MRLRYSSCHYGQVVQTKAIETILLFTNTVRVNAIMGKKSAKKEENGDYLNEGP